MIHQAILDYIQAELQEALIDAVPVDDVTRAGVVMQGLLQGDPDPDQARISVTLHENDPDVIHGTTGTSALSGSWEDDLEYVECGGSATWNRRFTVMARCLFVNSQEDKATAQQVARTVRNRIEKTLLNLDFEDVHTEDEYVSRGIANGDLSADMVQAGGPPDAYDYFVKVRFQVQSTTGVK